MESMVCEIHSKRNTDIQQDLFDHNGFVCLFFFFARDVSWTRLKVVTYYNQLHEVDEKMPCKDFELNVTVEESSGNSKFSHF